MSGTTPGAQPLLSIENLSVAYGRGPGQVAALRGVSFTVAAGENIGIVGESGCGKTTLIRAILRLMPRNGRITEGAVRFEGRDLLALRSGEMRKMRWRHLSFITQAAMNALNPVLTVDRQMTEAILTHKPEMGKEGARARARELFSMVGLNPNRLRDYPHQFSGGMKQRAVIAMALALKPEIIVADEPTTALDVVVQAQILETLLALQRETGNALILVTHDMSVVAQTCQRVVVMYGGEVVENGPVEAIFEAPFHPYTMGLRRAFPSVVGPKQDLVSIPGSPPTLRGPLKGCIFSARCPFALDLCHTAPPPVVAVAPGHEARCHRTDIAVQMRAEAEKRETWKRLAPRLETGASI
jgi:oligopeptide/dipeptide ABC transporter ATP-binding protein